MDRRIAVTAAGIVVLAGSLLGAAYGIGAGPFEASAEPKLVDFETTGATCVSNGTGDRFEVVSADGEVDLTVAGAIQLPNLARGAGNAIVERVGESNYTLAIEALEPQNGTMGTTCIGRVGYTADLSIPESANSTFSVTVIEDGRRSAVLYNGPDGSGAGADASADDYRSWTTSSPNSRSTSRTSRPP